jgi:hypothetical protein
MPWVRQRSQRTAFVRGNNSRIACNQLAANSGPTNASPNGKRSSKRISDAEKAELEGYRRIGYTPNSLTLSPLLNPAKVRYMLSYPKLGSLCYTPDGRTGGIEKCKLRNP